jgi:hypothetical protein|tara:strand:+ start:365 stop:625 length:261 start_codon:yes stop_codon:yes gene_type:complete
MEEEGIPNAVQPTANKPIANELPVKKKSKWWIWLVVIVVLAGVGTASYFIFAGCPDGELFNPYDDMCVSKNVVCKFLMKDTREWTI